MEKSLKKLNRLELLQLLLRASETNEALVAENDALRKSAEESRNKLPQSAKVGSIAEAALQANGYFESVQRSADDYLREIKRLHDQIASRAAAQAPGMPPMQTESQAQVDAARRQAQLYLQDAQARANGIVGQANQQAQAIIADARAKSEAAIAEANGQARGIIEQANRRADALLDAAQGQAGQPGNANYRDRAPQAVQQAAAFQYAPANQAGQAFQPTQAGQLYQTGRFAPVAQPVQQAAPTGRHAQAAYAAQPAYSGQDSAGAYAQRGRHARYESSLG